MVGVGDRFLKASNIQATNPRTPTLRKSMDKHESLRIIIIETRLFQLAALIFRGPAIILMAMKAVVIFPRGQLCSNHCL